MRGATRNQAFLPLPFYNFNPRSPCGERQAAKDYRAAQKHFNPRSPCGERQYAEGVNNAYTVFQSTLPVRGATRQEARQHWKHSNFNPRSPCGERPPGKISFWQQGTISIHAPRAGSDDGYTLCRQSSLNFNPRSPCGERQITPQSTKKRFAFQSTLPVRGATGAIRLILLSRKNFNPRSPCGERPPGVCYLPITRAFQSTLPVRGATCNAKKGVSIIGISIHAPRAGSDLSCISSMLYCYNFNPRSPCGERPIPITTQSESIGFQSTLPVRGATAKIHIFSCPSLARTNKYSHGTWISLRLQHNERREIRFFTSKKRCEPAGKSCLLGLRG